MNELSITVAGNVVGEVEVGAAGQTPRVHFRVAFNPRRWDHRTNGWIDGQVQYYRVTCWNRLAENVSACLRKGMPVVVRGKLLVRDVEHEGPAGLTRRTYVDIDAHHVGIDLLRGTANYTPTKSAAVVAAEQRAIDDAMTVARLAG